MSTGAYIALALGVAALALLGYRQDVKARRARNTILRTLYIYGKLGGIQLREKAVSYVGGRGTVYVYLEQLCERGLVERYETGERGFSAWGLTRMGTIAARELLPGLDHG